MSTVTTSYGSWAYSVPNEGLTVRAGIVEALGEHADDYDLDALERAYRDAIDAALPEGVTLAGDEFIGPHPRRTFASHPIDDLGQQDFTAIVEAIDFWALAAKFDRTAS